MAIAIIIPNYNDGASIGVMIAKLDEQLKHSNFTADLIIINDGGESCSNNIQPPENIHQVLEITLAVNLGHQRAIAVGLTEAAASELYDAVLIMDGDGEDRPEDALRLLETHTKQADSIIVAQRTDRSEALGFRLFYRLYKSLFIILTGKRIDFGNFMVLPANVVSSIVYNVNLWNHLAATVLAAKYPIKRLPTKRGERYNGESRMNFESLVTHGLSAISIFLPQIFTRILAALTVLLTICVIGIGTVIGIRYLTDLAIPGWASYLVGILLIIILQLILLLSTSFFAALNQRSVLTGIPQLHIRQYIKSKRVLYPRQSNAG